METREKVRENRLRRMADRRGYQLQRSRRRDPNAWDYGTYQLVDAYTRFPVAANWDTRQGYGLSLDEIEAFMAPPL